MKNPMEEVKSSMRTYEVKKSVYSCETETQFGGFMMPGIKFYRNATPILIHLHTVHGLFGGSEGLP